MITVMIVPTVRKGSEAMEEEKVPIKPEGLGNTRIGVMKSRKGPGGSEYCPRSHSWQACEATMPHVSWELR